MGWARQHYLYHSTPYKLNYWQPVKLHRNCDTGDTKTLHSLLYDIQGWWQSSLIHITMPEEKTAVKWTKEPGKASENTTLICAFHTPMLDLCDDWPIPCCVPNHEQLVNDVPTQEESAHGASAVTFWSSDYHIIPHTNTHSHATEPEQYQSHEMNAVFSQFLPSLTTVT